MMKTNNQKGRIVNWTAINLGTEQLLNWTGKGSIHEKIWGEFGDGEEREGIQFCGGNREAICETAAKVRIPYIRDYRLLYIIKI